ncbi:MAG: DNA mismatch repair protein MutS [Bdellovibrionaceae bacterium]|nr:DNA mismatch repair protein MutS [Pseudobdellovibrionaceae bacterium]
MRQYWEMKSAHTDKVLLFRMGDFFEIFFDDAVKAAPILGIALTSRNKKSADETPMCGVPHHSIGGHINKLLTAGLKVAICDQIEDPKFAKGIVKRAVTRVLTPGMVYDAETLEATRPNFVAAANETSLAVVDVTTGEALYWKNLDAAKTLALLRALPIAEIVTRTPDKDNVFDSELPKTGERRLLSRYDGPLSTNEFLMKSASGLETVGVLLGYIDSLEGDARLKFLRPFEERFWNERLEITPTGLRHLEIFETSRGERAGSLLAAVDRTKTSMGARLLRSRLAFPFTNQKELEAAWAKVEAWGARHRDLKLIRERLTQVGDLERRLTRLGPSTANARDLRSVQSSVQAGLDVLALIESITPAFPHPEVLPEGAREKLLDLSLKIDRCLLDELPLSVRQGGMIKEGVKPELDEALKYATHGQALLAEFEAREKAATEISSLKVRYNNVFGYYIEITNTHKDKAPKHYQRKQTLTNAERYTTDELVELERKVLSSQTRRFELEFEVFETLKNQTLAQTSLILNLALRLAEIDLSTSWAQLALERSYVKPVISESGVLRLTASRHPVVEQKVGVRFTANDIEVDRGGCLLLTGPNMAGKSTLMRQVALSVILAQSGGFVPARKAELPLFDRVFTRIGANDSLSEGLSTFMVEMKEASEIVQGLTPRSLVILDELGRGTSTFDGMSLAQALLEYLLGRQGGYFFFATHYHELTKLEALYPQVRNAHMAVTDRGEELRFLYSLRPGPALKSYGIHVAQLAGLPKSLIKRAGDLLKSLEADGGKAPQMSLMDLGRPVEDEHFDLEADDGPAAPPPAAPQPATNPEEAGRRLAHEMLARQLRELPLDQLTPLQALVRLQEWQSTLKDSGH